MTNNKNCIRLKLKTAYNKGNVEQVKEVLDYIKEKQPDLFTKNNAIWKLTEQVPTSVKKEAQTGIESIKKYDGVEIVRNFDADRIQIKFDKKPNLDIHNELRKSGWIYSRKNEAYQRKITNNSYLINTYEQALKLV